MEKYRNPLATEGESIYNQPWVTNEDELLAISAIKHGVGLVLYTDNKNINQCVGPLDHCVP